MRIQFIKAMPHYYTSSVVFPHSVEVSPALPTSGASLLCLIIAVGHLYRAIATVVGGLRRRDRRH